MQREKSIKQQQFILLTATLSILAAAVLLLNLREHLHHDLFMQIADHQLIVYHLGKAKEELGEVDLDLLWQQLHKRLDADKAEVFTGLSPVNGFNLSVSIYALRGHIEEMVRLQKKTGSHGPLSLKLERQSDKLLAPGGRAELRETVILDDLRRQIEGLILSMEQLEGVHGLHIKALTNQQGKVTRRDTVILFLMVATLAMLSYLSISLVMGRIQSMVEEQRILTRELERKNDELERFTYTVSHDLKSPLVTIKNFIGMLERNVRTDDRRMAYHDMEHISSAADDMAALLEGLHELSRIGRIVNPPQSGQLNDLVERAVDKLRVKIEARGIELQIDTNMPDYWGDRLRLQQVFQNLIENAVKFMGDQPTPLIRISAQREGNEVVCSICDNGIGIDPQYKSRVFNLFERLDQSVEGTGIGLALVQRIIDAQDGRVWVESEVNSPGCTVVFTLPVRPD